MPGSSSVPRQGGVIVVLDGKPTLLGGFHDYDKYPRLVEQFDIERGNVIRVRPRLDSSKYHN